MDANTDPRDVLSVRRWTTKQEVSKQLRERQSWNPYDILAQADDGLSNTLIFLTRDMGLDDALEPFRVFVSERALALFNKVTWMGKPYKGVSGRARLAYELANGLNGCRRCVVSAAIELRAAMSVSASIAVEQALGDLYEGMNCAYTAFDGAQRHEHFVLINKLVVTLESEGLL